MIALLGAASAVVLLYTARRSTEHTIAQSSDSSMSPSDIGLLAAQAPPVSIVPSPATAIAARPSPNAAHIQAARFSDPAQRLAWVKQQASTAISQRMKAEVEAKRRGLAVRGDVDGRTFEWAAWINGRPYVRTTCNRNAAISTTASLVRQHAPHFRDGEGIIVGLWDAGTVRLTHQELRHNSQAMDSGSIHSHSTHVAGTLVAEGVRASATGMAPGARLQSYDWNDDYGEMANRAMADASETNNISISNHSYGFQAGWFGSTWFGTWGLDEADGFGQYDLFAVLADQVCYNAPYFLPFKSAGNDRNDRAPSTGTTFTSFVGGQALTKTYNPAQDPPSDNWDQGGFDTIGHDASAKNIMTVGAVNDAVSGTNRHLSGATMTTFSSWGPTDDGRIKPDIVANGANLESSTSSSDDAYATLSGTSMASPNAAGSAVLIAEHFAKTFPGQAILSSMLKGLIIHSAVDLGRDGPDYTYGWGLMDTLAAVDHIDSHASSTNALRMRRDQLSRKGCFQSARMWQRVKWCSRSLIFESLPKTRFTASRNAKQDCLKRSQKAAQTGSLPKSLASPLIRSNFTSQTSMKNCLFGTAHRPSLFTILRDCRGKVKSANWLWDAPKSYANVCRKTS